MLDFFRNIVRSIVFRIAFTISLLLSETLKMNHELKNHTNLKTVMKWPSGMISRWEEMEKHTNKVLQWKQRAMQLDEILWIQYFVEAGSLLRGTCSNKITITYRGRGRSKLTIWRKIGTEWEGQSCHYFNILRIKHYYRIIKPWIDDCLYSCVFNSRTITELKLLLVIFYDGTSWYDSYFSGNCNLLFLIYVLLHLLLPIG